MRDIFAEDIQNILNDFDMSVFKDKTFLITGATGLIGKLCVKSLLASNMNIKVIALVRNLEKAKSLLGEHENLSLIVQDILTPITITNSVDYIIHGASTTSSKDFVEKPVGTILTTMEGTKNILEFAKTNNVKSIVYLSSMEVYGQINNENKLSEIEYGYINAYNTRSSYPESKKLAECLCKSFSSQYNIPVKVARLAQTVGIDYEYDDNRMVVQFSRSLIEKKDIVLRTEGKSKCTSVYISDAIRAIFVIISKGENGEFYNIANTNAYASVKEIAEMIANDIGRGEIKVKFDLNTFSQYPPDFYLNLNTSKLEALGWSAKVPLKEMYERLIESLCIKKGNV